jgi:hypothetical protein
MVRSGPSAQVFVDGERIFVLENGTSSVFSPPRTMAEPSLRITVAGILRGLLRLSISVHLSAAGS